MEPNQQQDTVINNPQPVTPAPAPKKGSFLPWLILLIIVLALIVVLAKKRAPEEPLMPATNTQEVQQNAAAPSNNDAQELQSMRADLEATAIDGVSDGI